MRALSLRSIAVAILSGLANLIGDAAAQEFPTQPIKIIVATPAGGIADLVGRTFAQKLGEGGKTAVVERVARLPPRRWHARRPTATRCSSACTRPTPTCRT